MRRKLMICFAHALVLIVLHVVYFNSTINVPLENEAMMIMSKIENFTMKEGKFNSSNYLFVNTGYDNSLVPFETEEGFPGNRVVTDRYLLTKFFEIMAAKGNRHKYILCDINFDTPSDGIDSQLNSELAKVKKLILPCHFNSENSSILQPYLYSKLAQADYITYEGKVSKMLLYDRRTHKKTLPLLMYEECTDQDYGVNSLGMWDGHKFIPFSIYPRYFYNSTSIKNHELPLGQVVAMLRSNSAFYDDIIKDKIVIIGNFENDRHVSLVGFMPGSLILFNTFLTLEAKYHLHSPYWFLFLFLSFSLLAYYALYFKKDKSSSKGFWNFMLRLLGLTGICIVFSLLSFKIFKVHTTIIPIVLYFHIVLFIRKNITQKYTVMKKTLVPALLLLCLYAPAQNDALCFVTSVKAKVTYMNRPLNAYDTISYQNVLKIKFESPGFVTLFSSKKGSFRTSYRMNPTTEKPETTIEFLEEVLRIRGKSVSLSSRGGCDCLIPYECVYANPEINDKLLVPDTFFFPARFDYQSYDSGFYFLQWQFEGKVINKRLKTIGNEVTITKDDLYFNDKYYSDGGPEDLILGICNFSSGKKLPSVVAKIKPNLVASSSLVDHFMVLEKSMPGATPDEVFQTFCTDVYVYLGKPDLCQLKKIVHYQEN